MKYVQKPVISVKVDFTNPGQFFACCGLMELADRLWTGVEAWFDDGVFFIKTNSSGASLSSLLNAAHAIRLSKYEVGSEEDRSSSNTEESNSQLTPLTIVAPVEMRLDWWANKSLKTWAGSMDARKIFLAMCNAIDPLHDDPFSQQCVVFDVDTGALTESCGKQDKKPKKREPFYFDGRRGAAAWSIDIGFSPDSLKLTTAAYPVVEAMCFVGLQRCRPIPTRVPRVFDYYIWCVPLDVRVAQVAVCGLLPHVQSSGLRFENSFRTDQRKHKAFTPAILLDGASNERSFAEI